MPDTSRLNESFAGRTWPPGTLRLRLQHYVRLPGGGTVHEALSQLNEQLAFEKRCAAFIRTEADRQAYEENIAPIVRALATCEELTQAIIEGGLKDDSLVAMGYSSPGCPPVQIPAHHWHFLKLDYEKGTAAAPSHGLTFHGIHVGLKEDLAKGLAMMERQRRDRDEASAQAFSYSPDFGQVIWRGERFRFGGMQRVVVGLLYQATVRGEPWQPGKRILEAADSKEHKMGNLFSKNRAWGRLILSNGSGLYRIVTH